MKKLTYFIIGIGLLTSCVDKNYNAPIYELRAYSVVPDSLREKQREFIINTVRASSEHMTGGDYEDVDETIEQAEATSVNLFSENKFGLIIDFKGKISYVHPSELTPNQKQIVDSLLKIK